MIFLWLWFFASDRVFEKNRLVPYIIIALIAEGLAYTTMYIEGHKEAKQFNEKLSEYKHDDIWRI